MKLSELISELKAFGICEAECEAREMFYFFGKIPRSTPILGDTEIRSEALSDAISRRKKGEPLQYIIGEVGFYRELYRVTPATLIPRSDTEILVDYAVSHLPTAARILDLCCGSGCIGISTVKNTPDTLCHSFDISEDAIRVAEENARLNRVNDRIIFHKCDLLSDSTDEVLGDEKFDAILSNPPYVTKAAYENLAPELYFEPKIALVGGGCDGGDFYRILTPKFLNRLKPAGFIAYEIGYDGKPVLEKVAKECRLSLEIIKDYSGCDRVAVLRKK